MHPAPIHPAPALHPRAARLATPLLRAALGAALLAIFGCASPKTAFHPTGDPLTDGPIAIEMGPLRDRVLWQYRMAAAAMQRGRYDDARQSLDDALARVGSIFNADRSSRKARSYFTAEGKKTFLGEPYERVMAYYYRGILYWRGGEPDNARACFRNAQFQDADAEEKAYASDYVLLEYLDGLASTKLKADGSDAFQRARASCRLAIPPEANAAHNVLFFLDYGRGPTKFAAGEYGEQLKFQPGASQAQEVKIQVGAQSVHVGPYDDLNFQATTRGGRVMDHILGNKAVFKSATDAAGNAAILSGAVLASTAGHNSAADEVGAGLIIAGVLSKIVSAATTPQADVRTWDNLPLYLSFASLQLPPGQHTAVVDFLDPQRRVISGLTKTVTFTVPDGGRDTVLYVSDQSTTPQTL